MSTKDWEDSSTTSDPCPTPTHSSYSTSTPLRVEDDVPVAGCSFMICLKDDPDYVITLTDGQLQLEKGLRPGGGWVWKCIQTRGWFGFRNSVSGTYIGHDNNGNIKATAFYHKGWEFLSPPQKQPAGGYLLHVGRWGNLHPLAIKRKGSDSFSLIEREDNGTAWEFVRLDDVELTYVRK